MPSKIDLNHLFTNRDIDMYLEKNNHKERMFIMNSIDTENLITKLTTKEQLGLETNPRFRIADVILAPVNIKNQHWILFVLRTKSKHGRKAYFVDPIEKF